MNYGKILKKLRSNNSLTQDDVAKILNVARITYSHYESQEKIIPLERLEVLCNYFGLAIDYIFGLTSTLQYLTLNKEISKVVFGTRLREFRKENKLTQKDLALTLQTSQSVIAEYERGRFLISTPFLYAICSKYKVSADYLLGRTDSPKYIK